MIGATPYASAGYQLLKVETHLHTLHSDGQASVAEMFEACASAGYQAVALTDHNTQSGLAEAREVAARLGLVLLPGVEVTTFRGHAVVLGVECVPEWRDLEARGLDALAAQVHAQGGLVCVAHPAALGSPMCSGCAWEWPLRPDSIDLWEVFSAPRPIASVALALWRQVLSAGGRAAPVAAGDVHSASAAGRQRTATHVYARQPSVDAVLEALRQGRVFASTGAAIELWLEHISGETALLGERVAGPGWAPRVVAERATIVQMAVGHGEQCVYAVVRDAQGQLEAISAPIWITTST